jgi:hypothetical protein
MMGEAAATTCSSTMSQGGESEEFSKLFKKTAVDETQTLCVHSSHYD